MQEYDYATFLERANASVRCTGVTGLEVKLYMSTSDKARAGYECSIIADLFLSGAGGLQRGHSYRLSRVTAV